MYAGIALVGQQGAGKDTLADHLMKRGGRPQIYRCKTPIVVAYEQFTGHKYVKGRDDGALKIYSRDVVRKENPMICAEFLARFLPQAIRNKYVPIVPDVRRNEEFYMCKDSLGMMMLRIDADEDVRRQRVFKRDETLTGWDPNDINETEVESLHCPYVIDNNKDDNGAFAIIQLENYLSRYPEFKV